MNRQERIFKGQPGSGEMGQRGRDLDSPKEATVSQMIHSGAEARMRPQEAVNPELQQGGSGKYSLFVLHLER
jgi:hypothetical protein